MGRGGRRERQVRKEVATQAAKAQTWWGALEDRKHIYVLSYPE